MDIIAAAAAAAAAWRLFSHCLVRHVQENAPQVELQIELCSANPSYYEACSYCLNVISMYEHALSSNVGPVSER